MMNAESCRTGETGRKKECENFEVEKTVEGNDVGAAVIDSNTEPSCSNNEVKERSYSLKRRFDLCPSFDAFNSEIREDKECQCDQSSLCTQHVYSEPGSATGDYEREVCVWKPFDQINDDKLLPYLSFALMHGIEQDRAMFILMKAGYDVTRAKEDLMRRKILKKLWCDRDITLFKRCCCLFGKRFKKFQYMLPHKTHSEIIEFYYNNKKLMKFRQLFSDPVNSSDSEEEKEHGMSSQKTAITGDCDNCGIENVNLQTVCEMDLCSDCHLHFVTFKTHRPCIKSLTKIRINSKAVLPVDVEAKLKDFAEFASIDKEEYETLKTQNEEDDDIQIVVSKKRVAERKLGDVKKRILALRSRCLRMEHDVRLFYKENLSEGLDEYQIATESNEDRRFRTTRNWNYKEKFFAFYAFERYGKDFETVASLIGTKNVNDVMNFYKKFSKEIELAYASRQSRLQKHVDEYDFTMLTRAKEHDVEIVDLE